MPARKFYPAPACPKCGKQGPGCSHVKDTAYTDDEILRHRECDFCGWKWWTRQSEERSINPNNHRVVIPDFKNIPRNQKRVYKIEPIFQQLQQQQDL